MCLLEIYEQELLYKKYKVIAGDANVSEHDRQLAIEYAQIYNDKIALMKSRAELVRVAKERLENSPTLAHQAYTEYREAMDKFSEVSSIMNGDKSMQYQCYGFTF